MDIREVVSVESEVNFHDDAAERERPAFGRIADTKVRISEKREDCRNDSACQFLHQICTFEFNQGLGEMVNVSVDSVKVVEPHGSRHLLFPVGCRDGSLAFPNHLGIFLRIQLCKSPERVYNSNWYYE